MKTWMAWAVGRYWPLVRWWYGWLQPVRRLTALQPKRLNVPLGELAPIWLKHNEDFRPATSTTEEPLPLPVPPVSASPTRVAVRGGSLVVPPAKPPAPIEAGSGAPRSSVFVRDYVLPYRPMLEAQHALTPVMAIIDVLEKFGDCPSVVLEQKTDDEEARDLYSIRDTLGQVTLRDHTYRVTKWGLKYLQQTYKDHEPLIPKMLVACLGHDLGKVPALAMEAGSGPCAPCTALGGVVRMRLAMGELAGAEGAARRWVSLQPDAPASWSHLAEVLSYSGRYDSALTVARRASTLAGDDAGYDARIGRILLMARRYAAADSAARVWLARDDDEHRIEAMDLRSMLLRARGRLRESNQVIERAAAQYPAARELELVRADGLARLGKRRDAARLYETFLHGADGHEPSSPYQSLAGDNARAFAWNHALLAEAIAPDGDTIHLRALADSIERIGARSYYGRDWRLHHHVRGLIAERGGRLREAIREFDAARWGSAGWTVTVAHMARAHIALGEPEAAIALLRDAYKSSPDAMGRYLPRSEIDLLMAEAFSHAGMRDSSARYEGYVRSAWADADPEVKSLLAVLGGS